MTNGNVDTIGTTKVDKVDARTITVKYEGGEKSIIVPADTPIVTYAPADMSALVKGARVNILATRNADGSLSAPSVSVGKDASSADVSAFLLPSPPVHSREAGAPERVTPLERVRVAFGADRHPAPGGELFEVRDGAEAPPLPEAPTPPNGTRGSSLIV